MRELETIEDIVEAIKDAEDYERIEILTRYIENIIDKCANNAEIGGTESECDYWYVDKESITQVKQLIK